MSKNDEKVELLLVIHHETDKAFLVSENDNRDDAEWLPKSQIEFVSAETKSGVVYGTFEVPQWLAERAGFV